jgi:hypothetical protein
VDEEIGDWTANSAVWGVSPHRGKRLTRETSLSVDSAYEVKWATTAHQKCQSCRGRTFKNAIRPGRLEAVGLCLPDNIAKQKKRRQVLTRGSGISWTAPLIGTNTRPAGPDLEIRKKNMEQSRLKFKCKEWIDKPNQVGWELGGPSKFGAIFQPRQGAEALN